MASIDLSAVDPAHITVTPKTDAMGTQYWEIKLKGTNDQQIGTFRTRSVSKLSMKDSRDKLMQIMSASCGDPLNRNTGCSEKDAMPLKEMTFDSTDQALGVTAHAGNRACSELAGGESDKKRVLGV